MSKIVMAPAPASANACAMAHPAVRLGEVLPLKEQEGESNPDSAVDEWMVSTFAEPAPAQSLRVGREEVVEVALELVAAEAYMRFEQPEV